MRKFPCKLDWLIVLFLPVIVSGCVTAGKYHDLEAKHQALAQENEKNKQDLTLAQAQVNELNGKLGFANTENTQLESSVTEMKTALAELQKHRQETEKRLAQYRELTAKFSQLVNSGKLSVKVINGRMIVALSSDILFSSGSSKLSAPGILSIQEVTRLLASLEGRQYQIEGYTDNVPIHTSNYPSNWELASARAMTVLRTMLEAGMAPERISAASYGETQPVASNDTPEGRAQNRRIQIAIVPDLSNLPGTEELSRLSNPAPAPSPSVSPSP